VRGRLLHDAFQAQNPLGRQNPACGRNAGRIDGCGTGRNTGRNTGCNTGCDPGGAMACAGSHRWKTRYE
jgi:hypothetical protein